MTKVVVTRLPLQYFYYAQWLILGLYLQKQDGKIAFSIKPKKWYYWPLYARYEIFLGLRKYLSFFKNFESDNYLIEGYIICKGEKVSFCYDIADTPYLFDARKLQEVAHYFKAQCPKTISPDGFELTPDVSIPYHVEVISNTHKISPAMLGPGFGINNAFDFEGMQARYQSFFIAPLHKTAKLMCYFGGSKGPQPVKKQNPDLYKSEAEILGHFGDKVSHPNEKRAVATKIIQAMGDGYDGRIIKEFMDDGSVRINEHLFIPLKEYTKHIAKFEYNLNISGFRLSIPNRFIYSFCVGTAIVTDELAVKWYKPFDAEVVEVTPMGYRPMNGVDWDKFKQQLGALPKIESQQVLDAFQQNWSPKAFAGYIIDTCTKEN